VKISSSALTIGVDIGGTKVSAGVVDSDGNIISSDRRSTPVSGGVELIATITDLIKSFQSQYEIAGIGISVAALISAVQGTIVGAPNIANLSKLNFVEELKKSFSLPVIAENDANSAMWAEYKFGNAKNLKAKELLKYSDASGDISGATLTTAAKQGNEIALSAFNKQADWLGSACASYTLLLDPQAIVIGGGVVEAGELFLNPVRLAMEKYMPFAGTHSLPKIVAAKYGNDAGLIGAADLVRG